MTLRNLAPLFLILLALAAFAGAQRFTMITNNTAISDEYPRISEDGSVCAWIARANSGSPRDAYSYDGTTVRQLTTGLNIPIPYGLTISGDGRLVGYIDNQTVWVVPSTGGTPKQAHVAGSGNSVQGPLTLSYDGSLICFTKYLGSASSADQWIARTDGSKAWNVTNRNGTSYHDREGWLSGDGKWVTYTQLVQGARNVWIVASDGSNPQRVTSFTTAGNVRFPVIDRFGSILAFGMEATPNVYQIYTTFPVGGQPILVSKAGVDSWMPYLSELDGEKVAFKTQEPGQGREEVYMAYVDGTGRRMITNFGAGLTRLTNSSHALNGDGTIGVYNTDQDFMGQNPTRDREIILFHDALTRRGPVSPGKTVILSLDVPGRPNDLYLVRCAFTRSPGIPIPGAGVVPLNPDDLFILSGAAPQIFSNFAGVLDKAGTALAGIALPNIPQLSGIRFYAAFVVVGTSGVMISNSLSLTIQ